MRFWIHPTRSELETGYRSKNFEVLMRKIRQRVIVEDFYPKDTYCATVVLGGVRHEKAYESQRTALRLLSEAPLGFSHSRSQTWYVLPTGRPLIVLVAADAPLDRGVVLQQLVDCGVVPDASG